MICIRVAGKESYPTLAYNVVVSHAKEIFHITPSRPGTQNDKTLVRFDNFITGLSENPVFRDVTYILRDVNGVPKMYTGAYVINDGGYHKWRTTIAGYSLAVDPWQAGPYYTSFLVCLNLQH